MNQTLDALETDSTTPCTDNDDLPNDFETAKFSPAGREIRTLEQLNTFIEDNYDDIRRLASGQCYRTPEQADDVAQELYPRLATFLATSPEGIREPWAFIRTAVRRLAIDELRRFVSRSRRFSTLYEDSVASPSEDSVSIQTEEDDAVMQLVHDVVAKLTPREQAVLTRIFFDGKRGRQVAREMQLSESYVAEIKAAALSHLQELLCGNPSNGSEALIANG